MAALDFREASKLPDDFLDYEFAHSAPHMLENLEEKYGREEAGRLYWIMEGTGSHIYSNMEGVRESLEAEAMNAMRQNRPDMDLSGITISAKTPDTISYYKDGELFAQRDAMPMVNSKYMAYWESTEHYNGPEDFPLIPTKDQYEDLGSSWIELGNPTWEDFEKVEKALAENKALETEFAAGLESMSGPDEGIVK